MGNRSPGRIKAKTYDMDPKSNVRTLRLTPDIADRIAALKFKLRGTSNPMSENEIIAYALHIALPIMEKRV